MSLQTRPIEYRGRFGLCLSGIVSVPFDPGPTGRIGAEQSMWKFLTREMGVPFIDEGMAKLTPEFLVHGSACPPGGEARGCAVRVRLGAVDKVLLALGDRHWDGDRPSAAQPFERMPLHWSRAYGGADFPANPQGIGRVSKGGLQALPNLELPGARLLRADQAVPPAGMGVLDVTHPQRAAFRGTYDDAWLTTHAPGFPPDLDWRHFNMAPSDQWLPGPLHGDEPFSLEHLHPDLPLIEGRLPGLWVRAFANYRTEGGAEQAFKLREVPMRLTTVWFFPHAERMILIFHGLAETREDDGADIAHLMGAVERLGQPKTDAHYAEVLDKRLDPDFGGVEVLADDDLLPAGIDSVDAEFEAVREGFRIEGLQIEAQFRRAEIEVEQAREALRAQGRDPDALGIRMPAREKPPALHELPAYLKAKQQEMKAQQWASIEDAVTHLERAMAFAVAHRVDGAVLVHRGPPAPRPAPPPGIAADAANVAQLAQFDRMGYLQSAHLQPPARPLDGEASARARADLQWMLQRGLRHFVGIDLTGADLSGLDLRGTDFSQAWLESVDLRGSNASTARFQGAVLAHANLERFVAIDADFGAANLGRARLHGAVFDRSRFAGTNMGFCDFTQTQFRKADIVGAQLLDTAWGAADWTGVSGASALFYRRDLRGLTLAEAALGGARFIECDLRGLDLRNALLGGAAFIDCRLDGACLAGAALGGAVFAAGTTLTGADFSRASLAGANLGGCDARGACFVQALLDGANLGATNLEGCDARQASAQGTLLRKARLARSRLAGINLREALLQHADLRGADLQGANLFGADLSRVRLDGDVRLDHALVQRARTWPRLSARQQAEHPGTT